MSIGPAPRGVKQCSIQRKLRRGSLERTIRDGLAQISRYADERTADARHPVVFDKREKPWTKEPSRRSETVGDVAVEARRA